MRRKDLICAAAVVAAVIVVTLVPVRARQSTTAGFLSDIPAGLPTPWTGVPKPAAAGAFVFTVFGDRTGNLMARELERLVERSELGFGGAQFVLSVGDLIEGYSSNIPTLTAMWNEFDAALGRQPLPFFRVPGNHDIGNTVMRDLFRARFGRDYYHFVINDVLFLALNTEDPPPDLPDETAASMEVRARKMVGGPPPSPAAKLATCSVEASIVHESTPGHFRQPNIGDEQVQYFERVLERYPNVRWTFLFMHKPAWRLPTAPAFARLEQRLASRKYTVFAGHNHRYLHESIKGRDYYVLGPSAALPRCDGDRDYTNQLVTVRFDGKPHVARRWVPEGSEGR